jgi:restriction system protein
MSSVTRWQAVADSSRRHEAKVIPRLDHGWVIRAGVRGNADNYFLQMSVIVLSDPGLGDLSRIDRSRHAFYQSYRSIRPKDGRASIVAVAGKYFRFVHEIKIGEIVIYPSISTGIVHVGTIESGYFFSKNSPYFPHQRKARWTATIPKDSLSQSAQYELGAARTLFKCKRHLAELLEKSDFQTFPEARQLALPRICEDESS